MDKIKDILLENKDSNFKIKLDIELLFFLFDYTANRKPHRLTKAEAFFDLIKRQYTAYHTYGYEVVGGGFQTLANAWQWNRATVKSFLHILQDKNVLKITQEGSSTTIEFLEVFPMEHLNENELIAPSRYKTFVEAILRPLKRFLSNVGSILHRHCFARLQRRKRVVQSPTPLDIDSAANFGACSANVPNDQQRG